MGDPSRELRAHTLSLCLEMRLHSEALLAHMRLYHHELVAHLDLLAARMGRARGLKRGKVKRKQRRR